MRITERLKELCGPEKSISLAITLSSTAATLEELEGDTTTGLLKVKSGLRTLRMQCAYSFIVLHKQTR